jgi:hypothetical protein
VHLTSLQHAVATVVLVLVILQHFSRNVVHLTSLQHAVAKVKMIPAVDDKCVNWPNRVIRFLITIKAANLELEWVAFLLHIRDVPGSNLHSER